MITRRGQMLEYKFYRWKDGKALFKCRDPDFDESCFCHNAWMESRARFSLNGLIHALLDREYKSSHLYSALLDALEAYEGTK